MPKGSGAGPKSSSSSSKKGGGQRFLPAVINPNTPQHPNILPDPNDPLSRYAGVRGQPMDIDPAARDSTFPRAKHTRQTASAASGPMKCAAVAMTWKQSPERRA